MAAHPASDLYPHGLVCVTPDTSMSRTLEVLSDFRMEPMPATGSQFVKPESAMYTLGPRERRWDVVESHESVGILLHHVQRQVVFLVRQFRPAVYASELRACSEPPSLAAGFSYELCAGIVDKNMTLEEIACEEAAEECGYSVPVAAVRKLARVHTSMGITGAPQTLFYAQVDDSMRTGGGGGLPESGESIEVLALGIADIDAFVQDDALPRAVGCLFALQWLQTQIALDRL